MTAIAVTRAYDPPAGEKGFRVLVDRLWTRGLSKARAAIDLWRRASTPSDALRHRYQHDPARWDEFRARDAQELSMQEAAVRELLQHCAAGTVTLLYASREQQLNNAVALREYLQARENDVVR